MANYACKQAIMLTLTTSPVHVIRENRLVMSCDHHHSRLMIGVKHLPVANRLLTNVDKYSNIFLEGDSKLVIVKRQCVQFGKQAVHTLDSGKFFSYAGRPGFGVVYVYDESPFENEDMFSLDCHVVLASSI